MKHSSAALTIEQYTEKNRAHMETMLKDLGCDPHYDDDNNIVAKFQGETFIFVVKGHYLRIWDPYWYSYNIYDPAHLNIDSAIHYANRNFGPRIVKTEPNEDNEISLISIFDLPMSSFYVPASFDILTYLLGTFFTLKLEFNKEMSQSAPQA